MATIDQLAQLSAVTGSDLVVISSSQNGNYARTATIQSISDYISANLEAFTSTRVLDASSPLANQQPSALDTPWQITFGTAVGDSSTDVKMDAAGLVTFNEGGVYMIEVSLQFGRTGASGVSRLGFRALANGIQAGATICANLDNSNVTIPFNEKSILAVTAGTTLAYQVVRASTNSGANFGGLFAGDVSPGWNAAPCARIRIQKLE